MRAHLFYLVIDDFVSPLLVNSKISSVPLTWRGLLSWKKLFFKSYEKQIETLRNQLCNSAFETTEILKLKANHKQFDVEIEKNKQTIIGLNQKIAQQKINEKV